MDHTDRKPLPEKRQLIEQIHQYNPGAGERFLSRFSEDELMEYLGQLEAARHRTRPLASWSAARRSRPDDVPGRPSSDAKGPPPLN